MATDVIITRYEDTTTNIATLITNKLTNTSTAKMLAYDTTLDTLVYVRSAGGASDYRYPLTLDQNYDSTTQIRRLTMNTAGWIGFGTSAGRIVFTDAVPDSIEMEDSAFHFNPDNDDFDFRLDGDTDDNVFYMNAGTDNVGIGLNSPSSVSLLHIQDTAVAGMAYPNPSTLIVETSSEPKIIIASGNASNCSIRFSDEDTGAGGVSGAIIYYHSTNILDFWSNGASVMSLNATGLLLGTGAAEASYILHVFQGGGQTYLDQSSATGVVAPLVLDQADLDKQILDVVCGNLAGGDITFSSTANGAQAGKLKVRLPNGAGSMTEYGIAIYAWT